MRGEVLGLERRRRWSDEEKLSILSMIGVGGMTVTQVAQRHDLTRQQIYTWRNVLKRKGIWHPDAALFLPVEMPEAPTATHAGQWIHRPLTLNCGSQIIGHFGFR
jgi:transposase